MAFLGLFKPRENAKARQQWLDSAVSRAASTAQNAIAASIGRAKRGFEAAETPAWTESWQESGSEINEDLARQLPILRARSRGLARNNEWAARYLIQLDDNVLGPQGIMLQMRVLQRDGQPDKTTNDRIESAWRTWGKRGNCEASGKLSWREVESQALASIARDGELLMRLRTGAGPKGFQVQILNPALLDVAHNGTHAGRRIRMGIEITDEGAPVAYWLRAAKSGEASAQYTVTARHVRIPAEEIIHAFQADEVDQLRGIPWLTIGARRLWMLHDFEESAAVASSNAAKRQGFFVSPNGDAPPGFADTIISSVLDAARAAGKVLSPEEIEKITAAAEKYTTTMPGQYDTLPQGYDFRPYESAWPNIDASSHVKQSIRGWAAARGMSYVTLGNDLEAVNYSSARVGIIDEREHYKAIQGRLASWLHARVFEAWLPYGILTTPGLSAMRLQVYQDAATWQSRRWQGIDPLKEAKAHEVNLLLGLTSRRRIQLERGDDPDEIAAEVAAELQTYGPVPGSELLIPDEEADA